MIKSLFMIAKGGECTINLSTLEIGCIFSHYNVLITLITHTYFFSRAQKRLVNSQKYGVDLVRFTHAKNAAIHASTKRDDAIRYLSLHDNKVINSFED